MNVLGINLSHFTLTLGFWLSMATGEEVHLYHAFHFNILLDLAYFSQDLPVFKASNPPDKGCRQLILNSRYLQVFDERHLFLFAPDRDGPWLH